VVISFQNWKKSKGLKKTFSEHLWAESERGNKLGIGIFLYTLLGSMKVVVATSSLGHRDFFLVFKTTQ